MVITLGISPLSPAEQEAFHRWGEALTTVARHPHIADVYGYGLADDRGYVVVRTGNRRTLAEVLDAKKTLPADQVRALGAALADALAAAHDAGLLHLGLHPGVIYVGDEQPPLLAGFDTAAPGLARPVTTGPCAAPEYRARKRVIGEETAATRAGPAADVYSLAATLHLALGGTPSPRKGDSHPSQSPFSSHTPSSSREPSSSGEPSWSQGSPTSPESPASQQEGTTRPVTGLREAPAELLAAIRTGLRAHPAQRPTAARFRDALLAPPKPPRSPSSPHDTGGEVLSGLPGVSLPLAGLPPATPPRSTPADSAQPDVVPPKPAPVVDNSPEGIVPLIGAWRISAGGEQELLVVDRDGAVTWTGRDGSGPFLATGVVVPIGPGEYRLLMNEHGGAPGFYVDLRLTDGGNGFVMDDAPDDGVVNVVRSNGD